MTNPIRIRARMKDNVTEIKAILIHPMETGRRLNEAGKTVPAHFIQLVSVTLNDKTVLEAQWGTGIAKNPYLAFRVKAGKIGDRVVLRWVDNRGESNSAETTVEAG